MAALRQTSFSAGELSPTLYGRTDLEAYHHGLRRCFNFYIGQHGEARSRPGSRYVGAVRYSNYGARLVPFISTDSEAYLLEFGNLYIRIYYRGAHLSAVTDIVTPWHLTTTNFEVRSLKFMQTGDILTITHPDMPPQELTRSAHTTWALAAVDFDIPALSAIEAFGDTSGGAIPQTAGSVRDWKYATTMVVQLQDGTTYETLPVVITNTSNDVAPPITDDGNFPATCSPALATPVALRFEMTEAAYEADSLAAGYRTIATRIYRGRGEIFGLIGQVEGPRVTGYGCTFIDYGDEPDYAQVPPSGTNPFVVYSNGALPLTALRTETPAAVGIFEQRMVFGGTTERPGRLWLSAVNDYLNFDERLVLTADGPIEIELASRRREQIRWVLGLDRLLVGTDQSIWAVGGAGGAPIDPTGLNSAVVQSEIGSSWRDPIVIGDSLLYVRSKGKGVRSLAYSNERGAFTGGDVSFFAQHLFTSDLTASADGSIADWTYAEDPHGLVWACRGDGRLLSLTYSREREMMAWAQHEMAAATVAAGGVYLPAIVESVCSIPRWDAPECDEVYLVVKRWVGSAFVRYIERLASEPPPSVGYACCLDASVTYHVTGSTYDSVNWDGAGTNVDSGATLLGGLDHLLGEEVWAVVDGAVSGPYTVEASAAYSPSFGGSTAGITIEIEAGVVGIAHVGLRYDCEIELLDAAESRENKKAVKFVTWEVEASRGLWAGERLPTASEETADVMTEWQQRAVSDDYDALALYTGRAKVRIGATWNTHGRAALRQVDPLPVIVVGVTREGEAGGK